ncbi:hypothetical protein [Streptomyces sp. NRRL S-350]|uniref:hypothetical protein n=1 Tax=Streptomyces sp. NRRL S-350 TaxID=1463902 RepID=UPI0004BE751C|nr:hypothetical protein [Streptomyces sp. NRRL S-350]
MYEPDPAVTISPETARHVLWHYDQPGGTEPDDRTRDLLLSLARCYPGDYARRALDCPEQAAAMWLAANTQDGTARLQAIASESAAP